MTHTMSSHRVLFGYANSRANVRRRSVGFKQPKLPRPSSHKPSRRPIKPTFLGCILVPPAAPLFRSVENPTSGLTCTYTRPVDVGVQAIPANNSRTLSKPFVYPTTAVQHVATPLHIDGVPRQGLKRALAIQHSPAVRKSRRSKANSPPILNLGARKQVQCQVVEYQPWIDNGPITCIPASTPAQQDLRPCAIPIWAAEVVLAYLARVEKDDDEFLLPPGVVEMLAGNLFDIFCVGSDELVYLALWYIKSLVPNGLLDVKDLFSVDGIIIATRVFLLGYTLAMKWHDDYSAVPYRSWAIYYGHGFGHHSVRGLEIAALTALDYNLYLSPHQYVGFLNELATWSLETSVGNRESARCVMGVHVSRTLERSGPLGGTQAMKTRRTIRPTPENLRKVHIALMAGLNLGVDAIKPVAFEKLPPIQCSPAADEVFDHKARDRAATSSWSQRSVYDRNGYFNPSLLAPLVVEHPGYTSTGIIRCG